MKPINELLRPHLIDLVPYASARSEFSGTEGIFLDANENPFGSVSNQGEFNRYPDPLQKKIKHQLSLLKNVQPAQIFLGNGSDEPIDLLIRAFCEPKQDNVIILPPTYGMYEVSSNINGIEVRRALLTPDFEIDTPKVFEQIDAYTKIIFLCSPNNPTGNLLSAKKIEEILQKFEGIVILDEAYIDFTSAESWLSRLNEFPNLVVLQTFSKAWGLAALRLGMAFAAEDIIHILNKIKPPYNINKLTQDLVAESLEQVFLKEEMVQKITEQRTWLLEQLARLPFVQKVYPSDTNFILAKMEDASSVMHYLLDQKVIIRDRSKVKLCEGCLRITVGTPEENKVLLEKLNSFSGELKTFV